MPRYRVVKEQTTWFEVTTEANDEDDLINVLNEGVDWEFIESDDTLEWEEQ